MLVSVAGDRDLHLFLQHFYFYFDTTITGIKNRVVLIMDLISFHLSLKNSLDRSRSASFRKLSSVARILIRFF